DKLKLPPAEQTSQYRATTFGNDLKTLLRHWQSQFAPRQPMVILQIDEMGIMGTLSYNTRVALRMINIQQPLLRTVFSGKEVPLDRENKLSPWWNFFEGSIFEVEPLTPPEARRLIVEPASDLFTFDQTVIDRIIARSEGKPLKIQKYCRDILLYK